MQGHGIGASSEAAALKRMGLPVPNSSAAEAPPRKRRKWETDSSSSHANTPMYLLEAKDNQYGLGYDPYANAEAFRRARQQRNAQAAGAAPPAGVLPSWAARPGALTADCICNNSPSHGLSCSVEVCTARTCASQIRAARAGAQRKRGLAFAPSVLEAVDAWQGELADYADDDADPKAAYANEIVSSDEDQDDATATLRGGPQRIGGPSAAPGLLRARQGTMGNDSFVEGFVRGTMGRERDLSNLQAAQGGDEGRQQRAPAMHAFAQPCSLWYGAQRAERDGAGGASASAPPVEAPSDSALKDRINLLAAMVARSGDVMLDLAKRTHQGVLGPRRLVWSELTCAHLRQCA
jgi:hypothetical protein